MPSHMFLNPWYSGQQGQGPGGAPPGSNGGTSAAPLTQPPTMTSSMEGTLPEDPSPPPKAPPPPPPPALSSAHSSPAPHAAHAHAHAHSLAQLSDNEAILQLPANLSADQLAAISRVQERLRPGWTVHMNTDGRFYYCK